jgi:hypothetical protein
MKKDLSVSDIKLKHLPLVSEETVDFNTLMLDLGYVNNWIGRNFKFRKQFKRVFHIVQEIREVDIKELNDISNSKIKYPTDVDQLPYQARLEIDQLNQTSEDITEYISQFIGLSCFTSQFDKKFNSDSKLYESFVEHIRNQPLKDMMALYNQLQKAIKTSNDAWDRNFLLMKVVDVDFEEANGPTILGRFSLLNLIKKLQKDFNVSYKEAFLLPYSLVQLNALEAASLSYVQERMTKIKERNMKRDRNKK